MEYIHDVLVAERMPFDEPIDPHAFRDCAGLESAVNRPFHTFGGVDLHLGLARKAAALFHSIACNHSFLNGNKRTAVMALDMFLTANGRCMAINNEDVYKLAKSTVLANLEGQSLEGVLEVLTIKIESESVPFKVFEDPETIKVVPEAAKIHRSLLMTQRYIREHPLNQAINPILG